MSGDMTIGEAALRAGVSTSAVRFYEKLGLLNPRRREDGHRRFDDETLRRLVFVGMLQDAGLSLDEIAGVLRSERAADWKRIARGRLSDLAAEIDRLQRAHAYLDGAMKCREEHPAIECEAMADEIDRRLVELAPIPPGTR